MITREMKVKTKEMPEGWDFVCEVPGDINEAIQEDGADIAYQLYLNGRDLKIQNRARTMFAAGKNREEVEAFLKTFKPGENAVSPFERAMKCVAEHALLIAGNSALMIKVTEALSKKTRESCEEAIRLLEDAAANQ